MNDISTTFTFQAIIGSFFIGMKLKHKIMNIHTLYYILPTITLLQVPHFSKHNTLKIMFH